MNLLVIGTDEISIGIVELALKSKHLDRIYTASSEPLDDIPNIEYSDFNELIGKSKALHIDAAITFDNNLIQAGISEEFKNHGVNLISCNKKWLNLETSRLAAKRLLNHYSINNPEFILAPLSFPIVLKTDKPEIKEFIYSMKDLIEIKQQHAGKNVFLEEYLEGEALDILSIWDGKNILTFDKNLHLTEVQRDRLDLFKTKLNFMLSDEKTDFTGFFTTQLIWAKNDWYVIDFVMSPNKKPLLNDIKTDFLFILNSVIYQKLNEL